MSSRAEAPPGAVWLTRVLLVPLVVLLVAAACVVTAKALAVREAGTVAPQGAQSAAHPPWKDSYARRFPGCVPAVLWPGRETPVAVVVKWDGRTVDRVERGAPLRRALAAPGGDRGRIIGACYR